MSSDGRAIANALRRDPIYVDPAYDSALPEAARASLRRRIRRSPVPIFVAGAHVDRIYPFGPLPGIPVMTVLLSHCGTACVGITLDPAAVTDPDLFVECVRQGFDEVTGRDGRTTVVPRSGGAGGLASASWPTATSRPS